VEDDLFGYLARYAVPVTPHVCIDNTKKTVKKGALWYEESLPSDTLLYVGLTSWGSRDPKQPKPSDKILEGVEQGLFDGAPYLQIGGNETVGMGWCKVGWLKSSSRSTQGDSP